ncbi:MAG: VWA domain-containing protein [Clostridia bacterium]|nr:VWA domain-containing protein [Clostridia bacterium]
MRNMFVKGFVGVMSAVIMSTLFVSMAFADESVVSRTQDNITVIKSASWTQVDGKDKDSNGNPYIKVDFKVDATKVKEDKDVLTSGGDVDVVLVLDNSMSYQDKFPKAKEAVSEFVDDVISLKTNNVRVGVVKFGKTATTMIGLSDNMTEVKSAVNKIELQGDSISGTNMHHGVCNASELLKTSDAKTKVIIILSDGRANRTKDNTEEHNRTNARKKVKEELESAKKDISNLQIVTVGYCQKDDKDSVEFLTEISTKDAKGNKMFYTSGDIAKNIASIFETISKNITSYVVGKSLVDIIPKECTVVEDSFRTNDTNIKRTMNANNHIVNFTFENGKLEKKLYELSFVMSVDKTRLSTRQLAGEDKLNTNGTTIDINVETMGSSFLVYSREGIIKLESPKLLYKESEQIVNVEENKNNSTSKSDEAMDDSPATSDSFNMTALGLAILTASILFAVGMCVRRK